MKKKRGATNIFPPLFKKTQKCVKCGNKCNYAGKVNKHGFKKVFCCPHAVAEGYLFNKDEYCDECITRIMSW